MRLRSLPPALLLGLAAFLAYRFTSAPGVLFGDPGEFQFTLPLAGLGHPTGYPLYHILGWLWERFYTANPAQGATHFSAFWGGVAVALFYLLAFEALSQLLARLHWPLGTTALASITTIVFAANPLLWAQATQAEVYTLHAAIVAGLMGAALGVARQDRPPAATWPVALLLGLGLAHHLTTLLLLPGLFLYLWLTWPQLLQRRWLLRLAPITLAPLLLYLYVPFAGAASPWLHPTLAPGQTISLFDASPAGVIRFILGTRFAPDLRTIGDAVAQIPFAGSVFFDLLGWPGLILVIMGVIGLVLEEQRRLALFTLLSFLLLVGFNLFYGIRDIASFYVAPMIIAVLWLGLGAAYTIDLIRRFFGALLPSSPRLSGLGGLLPLALALPLLILPYQYFTQHRNAFDRSQDRRAAELWEPILAAGLPADAVLVSNDRDEIVPLIYAQQVEGRAVGMTGLFPLLAPGSGWSDLNGTLTSALNTGRPVFLIKPMPGVEALYQVQAATNADRSASNLMRVLGVHPVPARSFEQPYGPSLRWLDIAWAGNTAPGGEIQVTLWWRVTQQPTTNWHAFLQIYNEAGEKVRQADDHRPGGDFLPSSLWRPGDVVVDHFTLPLPTDLPPGGYTLVTGFYDPITGARMADPLPVAVIQSP